MLSLSYNFNIFLHLISLKFVFLFSSFLPYSILFAYSYSILLLLKRFKDYNAPPSLHLNDENKLNILSLFSLSHYIFFFLCPYPTL